MISEGEEHVIDSAAEAYARQVLKAKATSHTYTSGGKKFWLRRRQNPNGQQSPFWYLDYSIAGRRKLVSTGESNLQSAVGVARRRIKEAETAGCAVAPERRQVRQHSVSPAEAGQRVASLLLRVLSGEHVDDVDAFKFLEAAVVLPPALRRHQGSMQMITQVRASGIYCLLKGGAVIYVGQTTNLIVRLASHLARKDFDDVAFMPVPVEDLNRVERQFIAAFPHCFNGNQGVKSARAAADGTP